MLGALRRQIFSSISRLSHCNFSDPRACVFEPTCAFSLFAYVVHATQEPTSVKIAWKNASKSWEARFEGPVALEAQLGVGWGNFQLQTAFSFKRSQNLRYISVTLSAIQTCSVSWLVSPVVKRKAEVFSCFLETRNYLFFLNATSSEDYMVE